MRELKFRAWDKKYNTMKEVDSIQFAGDVCPIFGQRASTVNNSINMDNADVMQYTGLKDRNGKEIYEGDIIEVAYNEINNSNFRNGQLVWHPNYAITYNGRETCFVALNTVGSYGQRMHELMRERSIKVIGNIYENPELLND